VYPGYRRVKGRRVRHGTRRLCARYAGWLEGRNSYAELEASLEGWLNHIGQADSAGLREHLFATYLPRVHAPGFALDVLAAYAADAADATRTPRPRR